LHCELDLGAAAAAGDKPVAEHDLWDERIDSPDAADVHESWGRSAPPERTLVVY
jgi:hypothetical protein